jgi:GT2 family glycosyltransferase
VTDLSVVILSWNTRDLLRACLRSIYGGPRALRFEVVVVDNASEDDSTRMVEEEFPEAILIRNKENEGYAKGNNMGMLRSRGEFILLLNSDTEVRDDALETMVSFLREHPSYGACGAQLLNADGTLQRACMRFPTLWVTLFFDTFIEKWFPRNRVVERYFMRDFDHADSRDVDQPPGACFMIRSALMETVGLLDENLFLFYNDVDYCKRIWDAGHKIHFLTRARVMHHGGKSTEQYRDFGLEWHKNRVRYYRKHFGVRGVLAAKLAALIKGVEQVWICWRKGCKLNSPEIKRIKGILGDVLKS